MWPLCRKLHALPVPAGASRLPSVSGKNACTYVSKRLAGSVSLTPMSPRSRIHLVWVRWLQRHPTLTPARGLCFCLI